MNKRNLNLGKDRIHAMALHDKVWNSFKRLKKSKGVTADRMLMELMMSYNNDKEDFENQMLKDSLHGLKHDILKQFKLREA